MRKEENEDEKRRGKKDVKVKKIKEIGKKIVEVKKDLNVNRKIKSLIEKSEKMMEKGEGIEWEKDE